MTDVHEAIMEEAKRRHEAEVQTQEAAARTQLVAKVYDALDDAVMDPNNHCGDADGHLGHNGYQAMAEAAVDVFIDYLRNPPVRVTDSDGTQEIRWAAAGLGKPQ